MEYFPIYIFFNSIAKNVGGGGGGGGGVWHLRA